MRSGQASAHQFEIVLAHTAIGTGPGLRHIFPARTGCDAVFRQACRFVIDEAAYNAHPGTEDNGGGGGFGHHEDNTHGRTAIVPYAHAD